MLGDIRTRRTANVYTAIRLCKKKKKKGRNQLGKNVPETGKETDSYLKSGLWSRNENPVADRQYRFTRLICQIWNPFRIVRLSDVRECSLCYGNSRATNRATEEAAARRSLLQHFLVSAVLSSGFVNKANTNLHSYTPACIHVYASTYTHGHAHQIHKCHKRSTNARAAVEESHYTINSLSIRHHYRHYQT